MQKGESGTWTGSLTPGERPRDWPFGHLLLWKLAVEVLVLDPYAKSLAAWNSEDADSGRISKIAKAAL